MTPQHTLSAYALANPWREVGVESMDTRVERGEQG